MVIVLGFIQLFISIWIVYYEYKRKSMSVFIWAVLLLMYGLPNFVDCILGNSMYRDIVLIKSNIFVILFCTIYLLFRLICSRKIRILTSVNLTEKLSERQISFCLIILFVAFITYIAYVYISTGDILGSTWNTIRMRSLGEEGHIYGNTNLLYILYSFTGTFFAATSGLLTYALCNKQYHLLIVVLAIQLPYVLISRSRSELLLILIPFILYFVFLRDRLNVKIVVRCVVVGFIAIVLIYFLQIIRLSGSLDNFFSNLSLDYLLSMIDRMISNSQGDLSLRNVFYYFVEHDNDFPGFGTLASYRGLLLLPIPSGLTFGLKPPDFAITMGAAWLGNPANTSYSVHPTLFGDCYANLGYYGVILGAFWALFISFIDFLVYQVKNKSDRILYVSAICCQYTLIARGSVYYGCRLMLISVGIIWICRHVLLGVRLKFGDRKIW